jgi:hypothetical protein
MAEAGVSARLHVALALVAVLLAVGAAVLAVEVHRFPEAAAREDARVAATAPADGWARGDAGASAAVRRMLDVGDAVQFRRALVLYRRARDRIDEQARTAGELRASAAAEAALADVERGDGPSAIRSRAATLEAVLLFDDAVYERQEGDLFLEQASDRLRLAIRLDPRNDDAKYDLELLLRLAIARRGRTGDTQAGTLGQGESGAGFGQAGMGY